MRDAISNSRELHGSPFYLDVAKKVKEGSQHTDLLAFYLEYSQGLPHSTMKVFVTTYNHFKRYIALCKRVPESDVSFEFREMNLNLLNRYKQRLHELRQKEDTIRTHFKKLKRVWRFAQGAGAVPGSFDPFKGFLMPVETIAQRDHLTEEEMITVSNLDCEGNVPTARDTFLFQCYMGGTRISDVLKLKVKDVWNGKVFKERVNILTQKTKTMKSFKINNEIKALITPYLMGKKQDDFLCPWMQGQDHLLASPRMTDHLNAKTASVNKALKKVAELAGIDKVLTTHTSRRSIATHLVNQGVHARKIQGVLGHKTLEMTEKYLKSLDQAIPMMQWIPSHSRRKCSE